MHHRRTNFSLWQIYEGAGALICGHGVKFALTIVAYGAMAQGLGVQQFGVFALIQAYVSTTDRVVNFQSRQALIKYGAQSLRSKRYDDFIALFRSLLMLDAVTAIFATMIAVIGLFVISGYVKWSESAYWSAILYCLILPFNVNGSSVGVLRLFNRFTLLSAITIGSALTKLIGVIVAYRIDADLSVYVITWVIADVLERVSVLYFGWRELKLQHFPSPALRGRSGFSAEYESIWRFLWSSNVESSIRLASHELDVFIVAAILNLEAVAAYKVIKEVTVVINGVADTVHQASYPVFANVRASGGLARMATYLTEMRNLGLIVSALVLCSYYAVGEQLITVAFGTKYNHVFLPMLIAICGPLIWLSYSGYLSAMYALGLVPKLVWISFGATIVSIMSHFILTTRYGLTGAAISYGMYFVVWVLCSCSLVNHRIRNSVFGLNVVEG